MKQNAKICAIGEQNVINLSLYLRRTKKRKKRGRREGEERGLRKGAERGDREKRDKTELG